MFSCKFISKIYVFAILVITKDIHVTYGEDIFLGSKFQGDRKFLHIFHDIRLIENSAKTIRIVTSIVDSFQDYIIDDGNLKQLLRIGEFFLGDILVLISTGDNKTAIMNIAPEKRDSSKLFEKIEKLISGEHAWTNISDKYNIKTTSSNRGALLEFIESIQTIVNEYAPIGQYLDNARKLVLGANKHKLDRPKFLFVIGNESCDLDSAISAIGLAYFLSNLSPEEMRKHVSHFEEGTHIVPLLQIENIDLVLKSESLYYMKENRLNFETVLTVDEVFKENLDEAHFILVDHYLPTYPAISKDKVVAIFDHHMDYKILATDVMPRSSFPKYSRIFEYGSSATVIAEFVLSLKKPLTPSVTAVLRLLHGPIFLDTDNLINPKSPKDIAINNAIENALHLQEQERNSMYADLNVALVDVTGLRPSEILRKDLKIATMKLPNGDSIRVAVPFIRTSPKLFMKKPMASSETQEFLRVKRCSIGVIMGRRKSGDVFETGISIIPAKDTTNYDKIKLRDEIQKSLFIMNRGDFTTTEINLDGHLEGSLFYDQKKGNSRKDVLPYVKIGLSTFVHSLPENEPTHAAATAA